MKYENEKIKRMMKTLFYLRENIRLLKSLRRDNHEDREKVAELNVEIDMNYDRIKTINDILKD